MCSPARSYWSDPLYFYPERGTLGYTDALFLVGAVYAVFRAFGADVFTAYMLAISVLAMAGFVGFFRLAVRHFAMRLPPPPSGRSCSPSPMSMRSSSSMCRPIVPCCFHWLCDLVLSAWRSMEHWRSTILSIAAGLLYAALFLTAFQTAWFFGCYLLLLAPLHPLVFGLAQSRMLLGEMLVTKRHVVLGFAVGFAVGIAPFLSLYLPVILSGRSRDFAEVASNMPGWRDLLNVTPENAVWGDLLRWLGIVGRPHRPPSEVELAFTPAVLAVFLIGIVMLLSPSRRDDGNRWFVILGAAVIIGWLMQMDYGGVRPWQAVWAFVPGAGAVRYTFRSQLVANLFVALVVARILMELARTRVATLPLAALLIVEQANLLAPLITSRPGRARLD